MRSFAVLCSLVPLAAAQSGRESAFFDSGSYTNKDILHRDVAVIGGGSSGTYGAIKLRDMGKSVVVVERASVLGGHENTYIDPATGTPIDYGVQAYWNISAVTDFFARFDIPIAKFSFEGGTAVYADFKTGQVLPNFTYSFNLSAYSAQLDKYPDLSWSWNLPYPVPQDFLLPFGEFIEKYSLQSVAYGMFTISGGVAHPGLLEQLTINVFKWIDHAYVDGTRGHNVMTARNNNGELYVKALAELGSDALISSTVIAAQRPTKGSGVRLVVRTPTGNKLIVASQLLVSIPPMVKNMNPFDLDPRERGLFSRFSNSFYYAGLINNTGFPPNHRYLNVGADTRYHIPNLPGIYSINPTAVDGIFRYWYASPVETSEKQIQAEVTAVVRRLTGSDSQQPGFVAFNDHSPFKLVVSAEDISGGFYRNLLALQGYRNTWYTGAAFLSHSSGGLWNFTQALLPKIVAAI